MFDCRSPNVCTSWGVAGEVEREVENEHLMVNVGRACLIVIATGACAAQNIHLWTLCLATGQSTLQTELTLQCGSLRSLVHIDIL